MKYYFIIFIISLVISIYWRNYAEERSYKIIRTNIETEKLIMGIANYLDYNRNLDPLPSNVVNYNAGFIFSIFFYGTNRGRHTLLSIAPKRWKEEMRIIDLWNNDYNFEMKSISNAINVKIW